MGRRLVPELLDSLPPGDPAAVRSRRELVRVNRAMGNPAWFRRTLPPLVKAGERVLEVGAGDGALTLSLRAAGIAADALDQFAAPPTWPVGAGAAWHVADLLTFARWEEYPVVAGNLILHHFDRKALAGLGARFDRHARVLVFNEPLRCVRSRLLWAVGARLGGAGYVTRHDGRVSIDAGFRGTELAEELGLATGRWDCRVEESFFGACRLVAVRRP